jgi:hypothetical protein
MRQDSSLWSRSFVEFVAMRGYEFIGSTSPLAGGGTDLKGLSTAKAAVRLIANKWQRLEDATCHDSDDGKSSAWRLRFDADWNGDRRIVGFWVGFKVDALGWELLERFETATALGWPDPSDPLAWSQKDWEGRLMAYDLPFGYGVDPLIKFLRKGGNPFTEFGEKGNPLGHEGEAGPDAKPFLDALREAIGPREGWHVRIAPLLTDAGIEALRAKVEMKLSIPKAKTTKRSLKERTDIM